MRSNQTKPIPKILSIFIVFFVGCQLFGVRKFYNKSFCISFETENDFMKNNVMQLKMEFKHEKFEFKSSHMVTKLCLLFQGPSKNTQHKKQAQIN